MNQQQEHHDEQLQIKSLDFRKDTYDQIEYKGVKQVSYLQDFLEKNPEVNYKALDIKYLDNQKQISNPYSKIADDLDKKLSRNGHILKPSQVSKKLKKNNAGQGNFYNLADKFIDDEQQYEEIKQTYVEFTNFKCVSASNLEQFYKSSIYKNKINEVTMDEAKRKIDRNIIISPQSIQKLTKKIKQNIQDKAKMI